MSYIVFVCSIKGETVVAKDLSYTINIKNCTVYAKNDFISFIL